MIDSPSDPWYKKILLLFLEVLIFGVIVVCFGGIVFGLLSAAGIEITEEMDRPFHSLLFIFLPQIIMFSLAMYVCNSLVFQRPLSVTGFVKEGMINDTSNGYLTAFMLIVGGFIILKLTGSLSMEGFSFQPYYFFGFFVMFLVQSAGEEVLARSWLMPAIESRFGAWPALLIASALFSMMHFNNPNTNWVGLLNIFLAGMMLGLFFLKYRNIWYITGLHAGWNWIQATVFDFNVSGHDVHSMINFSPYGDELISGGEFGFEGSIVSCILMSILIGYLLVRDYDDMFGNRPEYYKQELFYGKNTIDDEAIE